MRPAVKWCCFNVSIVVCRKHHNSPTTIGRNHELGHLNSTLWAIGIHTGTKTTRKDIRYAFRKNIQVQPWITWRTAISTANQQYHPLYAEDTPIM